jgi:hypothetical protein
MKTATQQQPEKLEHIHGAVKMAVRVLKENSGSIECSGRILRLEQVAIERTDGSVWTLEILVPQGDKSLTLRSAAWSLERELRGMAKHPAWKRVC